MRKQHENHGQALRRYESSPCMVYAQLCFMRCKSSMFKLHTHLQHLHI